MSDHNETLDDKTKQKDDQVEMLMMMGIALLMCVIMAALLGNPTNIGVHNDAGGAVERSIAPDKTP